MDGWMDSHLILIFIDQSSHYYDFLISQGFRKPTITLQQLQYSCEDASASGPRKISPDHFVQEYVVSGWWQGRSSGFTQNARHW